MEMFKKQREHPLSYLCKICGKSFVSGRALGGHMRVHATASIAADRLTETNFQKSKRPRASDHKPMEGKEQDEEQLHSNGMYSLRKNPKRSWRFTDRSYSYQVGYEFDSKLIDSSRNCDLRGKEFSSSKGLFGHVKCQSETHQDSCDAHPQQNETQDDDKEESESDAEIEIDHPTGKSSRFDKWMKGKGSRRPRYGIQQINPPEQFDSKKNNEEEDAVMCLVMLASGVNTAPNPRFQMVAEQTGSADLKVPNTGSQLPKCSRKRPKYKKIDGNAGLYSEEQVEKTGYKCNSCNKVFHSHQALGGHRASHSKARGYFSQITDGENESLEEKITDEEVTSGSDSFRKRRPRERTKDSCVKASDERRTIGRARTTLKIHKCSMCDRVFPSGQALRGHKRFHWGSAAASDTVSTISSNKNTPTPQQQTPARLELLDLNLPAPVDDDCESGNLNNLSGYAVDSHAQSLG